MTQQKKILTKHVIGRLLEVPTIYYHEDDSVYTFLRLAVKQFKISDKDWEVVPTAYRELAHVYGELVSCVEHLKVGTLLELRGYTQDKIWVDDEGMTRQSAKFVLRGIRVILPEVVPAAA